MKKRHLYWMNFIFIMFLVSLFLASADGTNNWIECASTCGTSKCTNTEQHAAKSLRTYPLVG